MLSNRKIWIAVGMLILFAPDADAQNLFGNRTLGRGLSRRTSPGSEFNLGGAPDAGRRFLRDERTVNDFVGTNSADAGATGFVGGVSAVNSAVSSVTGLTEQVRVPINRPKVNRPTGLYAERLSLSPELETESAAVAQNLQAVRVSDGFQRMLDIYGITIEVYPATHSAICADRFLPNGIARRSTPRDARTRDSNDPKRVDGGFRRFNLVL